MSMTAHAPHPIWAVKHGISWGCDLLSGQILAISSAAGGAAWKESLRVEIMRDVQLSQDNKKGRFDYSGSSIESYGSL